MKFNKILFIFIKYNRLILYTVASILTFVWIALVSRLEIRDANIHYMITSILSIIMLILTLLYKKIPQLLGFTIFILSLNAFGLAVPLFTHQVCGTEFYIYGSIPAIFIFTTDLKKPKYYYLIMNTLFFISLIILTYIKITQPLESLFLFNESKLFSLTNYYTTFVTSGILLYACLLCDILLKKNNRREKFIKESVDYSSKHDPLTGLMNRLRISNVFKDCENAKLSLSTDYAIAMFDIDDFKKINDIYGHSAGDYVLKIYSKRIWDEFPPPIRVGRWGGEEFVIIFPEFDDEIIFRLDDVRARICSEPIIFEGKAINVSATYGISSSRNLSSPQEVLNDADKSLYIGKQNGKNRLVVSEKY